MHCSPIICKPHKPVYLLFHSPFDHGEIFVVRTNWKWNLSNQINYVYICARTLKAFMMRVQDPNTSDTMLSIWGIMIRTSTIGPIHWIVRAFSITLPIFSQKWVTKKLITKFNSFPISDNTKYFNDFYY